MIIWIQKAVGFAALIMLAALGELLTEKSGGLNLGTPGTMCVGAATGFMNVNMATSAGAQFLQQNTGAQAGGGYCPFCGQPVPAGAKFCPSCGKQLQ